MSKSKSFINWLFTFSLSRLSRSNWFYPIVFGVFLKPLDDSFSISSSVVVNGAGFVFSPEFEGWESLNVESCNFVFSWVDFGKKDVGVVGQ